MCWMRYVLCSVCVWAVGREASCCLARPKRMAQQIMIRCARWAHSIRRTTRYGMHACVGSGSAWRVAHPTPMHGQTHMDAGIFWYRRKKYYIWQRTVLFTRQIKKMNVFNTAISLLHRPHLRYAQFGARIINWFREFMNCTFAFSVLWWIMHTHGCPDDKRFGLVHTHIAESSVAAANEWIYIYICKKLPAKI